MSDPANALADSIISKRVSRLEGLSAPYPRRNSILSDISECDRQMVYSVLEWEKKPLAGPDLQARFEAGKGFERDVVRELLDLGFDFEKSQLPVQIKNRNGEIIATGKIDGMIKFEGVSIPVEIKSMHPQVFQTIKSAEDFQKKPYLRKYTRQLQTYMLGNSCEWGLFIVGDLLGNWKLLPIALDYGEAEAILQRLERVHEAIKKKEYPNRIVYDQSICGKCPFSTICLQDVVNTEAEFVDSVEMDSQIERHEELKPLASEYDSIHENLKESFKGKSKVIVNGRWLIQSIPSKRTTYELPKEVEEEISEIKKQYAVKVPVERMVIEKLSGGNK